MEYDVVIRFSIKAVSEDDAKNVADAISDLVFRRYGFDSSTQQVFEYD